MKKIKHIAPGILDEILADYKAQTPDGNWRFKLREIAGKFAISTASVSNIAGVARLKHRTRGGRALQYPTRKHLEVLRAYAEPGMTLRKLGASGRFTRRATPDELKRNPGTKTYPITFARLQQIVSYWKNRKYSAECPKSFRPGDVIELGGLRLTVVRYDDNRRGAVKNAEGQVTDPFYWACGGEIAKLRKRASNH